MMRLLVGLQLRVYQAQHHEMSTTFESTVLPTGRIQCMAVHPAVSSMSLRALSRRQAFGDDLAVAGALRWQLAMSCAVLYLSADDYRGGRRGMGTGRTLQHLASHVDRSVVTVSGTDPAPSPCLAQVFSASFNNGGQDSRVAVVDERGVLGVFGCEGSDPSLRCLARAVAHDNAIFDVHWSMDDARVVTASGDFCCHVSDAGTLATAAKLVGHSGTVKSVRFSPSHPGTRPLHV